MTRLEKTLELRSSPHVLSGHSVDTIMFNVVLALVPVTAFSVYAFGLSAVVTLGGAVASCVGTEHLLCRVTGKASTVGDWSVTITGLLYGLTLPPGLPLWMVVVGGVIAVGVGKHLFGGLGANPFNPALVGRAILQAAFPVSMTTWVPVGSAGRFGELVPSILTMPLSRPEAAVDVVSGATPLAAWKFERQLAETGDLFLGMTNGSAGETCALLILIGGAWLVARRMMNWRIPVVIFAVVGALSGLLHLASPEAYAPPQFMLLSGGLMLGAVFMASDMVGSPLTHLGSVVYAVFIGILVVVIRVWGGMPEGVMYAVLFGNAATPLIDRLIQPRVFGVVRHRGGQS